jgi:catechol 2,3-dioxygenase-like lactoylglutathione lyase family enzyme
MTDNVSLGGINLFVRDMQASLAFYRLLGLAIPSESVWPDEASGRHVAIHFDGGHSFELDTYSLTKAYDPGFQEPSGRPGCVVTFRTATRTAVDETYARITAAGHESHLAPFDAFWGARYAIVLDPDGNQIGIMSPSDPAMGGAPPSA